MGQVGNLVVVGVLTIASGLLDARGFVYASRAWPAGQLVKGRPRVPGRILRRNHGLHHPSSSCKRRNHERHASTGIWSDHGRRHSAMDGTIVQWTRSQQIVGTASPWPLLPITTRAAG
jgi:hypothetical protein